LKAKRGALWLALKAKPVDNCFPLIDLLAVGMIPLFIDPKTVWVTDDFCFAENKEE